MKSEKNKLTLVFLLVLLSLQFNSFSQKHSVSPYYSAIWKNDTLITGNNLVEIKCLKTKKGLDIRSIANKKSGQVIQFNETSSVFSIGNLTDSLINSDFKKEIVPETPSAFAYMKAEIISSYKKIDVTTCFRIYTDCPMIVIDYSIKKKDDKIEFTPEESSLINFQLTDKHWLFKAVEFFDWTDYNNTLVQEHEGLSFRFPLQLNGNILQAKNLLNQNALIIVKEAPCSYAQLHSPGYDFYSHDQFLSVRGIGVLPDDLPKGKWIRTYSVALGVTGSEELDFLTTIRRYQKKLRKNIPPRDDMIMMNTWGDRNRDASIGEEFLKNEIDACNKLHITHFQIDDGWQSGRSQGSSDQTGPKLWDEWEKKDWQPDPGRFPNGFKVVNDYSIEKGVQLGLWFHPSNENEYARWKQDAGIVIDLYNDFGIRYFKIDGVQIPTKKAELNFRHFLDSVAQTTNYDVVFNLDMTHNKRGGYFYLYEYGNIFLENRYSDWVNYYPYWTLRNLWQLSKYVPAEKLQIEFLNNQRNKDKYPEGDIFAPYNIPFDYTFAVTMMAQPLAWFEGSNLFEDGYSIAPMVKKYLDVQTEIHSGQIFPIGDEPSGRSWTGFQSILDENSGYLLIFREYNNQREYEIKLYQATNKSFTFEKIIGYGESFIQSASKEGKIKFSLPDMNQFVLFKYSLK